MGAVIFPAVNHVDASDVVITHSLSADSDHPKENVQERDLSQFFRIFGGGYCTLTFTWPTSRDWRYLMLEWINTVSYASSYFRVTDSTGFNSGGGHRIYPSGLRDENNAAMPPRAYIDAGAVKSATWVKIEFWTASPFQFDIARVVIGESVFTPRGLKPAESITVQDDTVRTTMRSGQDYFDVGARRRIARYEVEYDTLAQARLVLDELSTRAGVSGELAIIPDDTLSQANLWYEALYGGFEVPPGVRRMGPDVWGFDITFREQLVLR